MPAHRLPQVPPSTTAIYRSPRRMALATGVLALVVALAACAAPTPPPPPPDVDGIVLLVANYSDNRIEVMGAESDAALVAARPAEGFADSGAASTVSVVWGPGDRIYVSDFALGQIRVYDVDATLGSAAATTVAVITSPDLIEPYALAFDSVGNLWVSDLQGSRPGTPVANRLVKLPGVAGATGATVIGAATIVTLDATNLSFGSTWITSLYFDSQDDLWFTDTLDWAVSRVGNPAALSGTVLGLVPELRLQSLDGINNDLSDIRNPVGMAVDAAGNLYVGNRGRDKVARFDGAASLAGDYVGSVRQADANLAVSLTNTTLVALAPDGALWVGSSGPTDLAQLVRVTGQAAGSGDVALAPTTQFGWAPANTNAFHEAGGMLFHTR